MGRPAEPDEWAEDDLDLSEYEIPDAYLDWQSMGEAALTDAVLSGESLPDSGPMTAVAYMALVADLWDWTPGLDTRESLDLVGFQCAAEYDHAQAAESASRHPSALPEVPIRSQLHPILRLRDELAEWAFRVMVRSGQHRLVVRALRRTITALRMTFAEHMPFDSDELADLLGHVRTELAQAAAVARKAGDTALADLLDTLATGVAVVAERLAHLRPVVALAPRPRALAPPGRPPTAHPLCAHAPPVVRVSAAAA